MKIFSKNGRRWCRQIRRVQASGDYDAAYIKTLEKYYKSWSQTMLSGDTIQAELPWVSYSAIDCMNQFLRPEMEVFEYGGGGSTLFFASRVQHLVTVEHSRDWFGKLKSIMESRKGVLWDGFLLEGKSASPRDEINGECDVSNPDRYLSADEESYGLSFKEYAALIDQYTDVSFDLILIDGRARPSCLKHAIPRCRPGGLLVLDNSDREYYTRHFADILNRDFEVLVTGKCPAPFLSHFTETTIWRKK